MNNKMMNGPGFSIHQLIRDKKYVSIDFCGYEPKNINFFGDKTTCFRNDASVLFFAANSYWNAFNVISDELKKRFEENYPDKEIERLILPYYFNFRHFAELELKALIAATSKSLPNATHNLNDLLCCLKTSVDQLEINTEGRFSYIKEDFFEKTKGTIGNLCIELETFINQYNENEYSQEYYRYIFETEKKQIILKHPIVQLDYPTVNTLFTDIKNTLYEICKNLSFITYVYFFL